MEHSSSSVTLSQVKDILATSGMVQALHTQINPHPDSSFLSSPSAMAVDLNEASSSSYSCVISFDPWTDAHPLPALWVLTLEWKSWLMAALSNGVPVKGLHNFVHTFGALVPGVGKGKWMQVYLKILAGLSKQMNLGAQWDQ